MTISVVPAFDAIRVNIDHLPHGQHCGYTTGGGDIEWTDAQFAADPTAVRICQDASATDGTADVLDVERGAATLADIPGWVHRAHVSFAGIARPGQREPAIYTSASNVAAVASVLKEAGLTSKVFLWMADWNLSNVQANKDVEDASGIFPICGVQWKDGTADQPYDTDVFSRAWLANRSHVQPVQHGPYIHLTNGKESLSNIANGRHEGVLSLLGFTAEHYSTADVNQLADKVLPPGVVYYTRNP